MSLLQRLERAYVNADMSQDETAVMGSILANLRVLLNSRQGCCETRTDYGLADFDAAANNFRNAVGLIARNVEQQVRQFEPRLRNVVVKTIEDKTRPLEVVFHVNGDLAYRDRTVRMAFDSVLSSDGHMRFNG
ncbi:type VI secretion system baseplate subunit TssE [Mesorhizobium sp. PL10]